MLRERINNFVRLFVLLVLLVVGSLTFQGCSSTQCAKAQRVFDAANAGYDNAQAAGKTGKADEYKWAADSAEAMLMMWCVGVE